MNLKEKIYKLHSEFSQKLRRRFKQMLEASWFENLVAKIISYCMKFSYHTTKWTVIGEDIPNKYHKSGNPFIVCLWHDRLMIAPCVWKWEKPLYVLASAHRDGKLIAKVVENFAMPPVFGSTGKGLAAAKELIKLARSGEYIAIIPDGPQGPRHKFSLGAIAVSRLSNVDILTYSFCVKRYHRFSSWDRFIFAWPFNKGVMIWGEPITPKELSKLSEEDAIKLAEDRINSLSQEAYRILQNA